MAQFYIWVIPSLGEDVWMPSSVSPPGTCLPSLFDWPGPLIVGITNHEWLYLLFERPRSLGQVLSIPLGTSWHLSAFTAVPHCPGDPVWANFLTHLKVWGDAERFCSNVALLLVLPKEGVAEERVYGLAMVWVHPYQAWVSTLDSTAEQLTQLASTGPNWPYTLVWLNGDACHVPLPKDGHLGTLAEKHTSHVPYRRIQHLDVPQLLSSGSRSFTQRDSMDVRCLW